MTRYPGGAYNYSALAFASTRQGAPMTNDVADVQSLAERLGKVEKQNRLLRIIVSIVVAVVVVSMLLDARRPKAIAVYAGGTNVGWMSSRGRWGPWLGLMDIGGNVRATLTVPRTGPYLALYDETDAMPGSRPLGAEHARVVLGWDQDGSARLMFSDARGNIRAALGVEEDGKPSLRLHDAEGNVIFHAP